MSPRTAPPTPLRCAADLAWMLLSPPLLNLEPHRFSAAVQSFSEQEQSEITAWLANLDTTDLAHFVARAMPAKAAMRLGRYAERLLEYFLRHSPTHTLTAANVALRRTGGTPTDHTTIGEFDYLLHTARGDAQHWELAVKFYLCHAASAVAVPHDFKGPAGVDTLGLKLAKIFGKQLLHLPPAPYDQFTWAPFAYARGWLFYPYNATISCPQINPAHLRGWWMSSAQFSTVFPSDTYCVLLPRLAWLAPYSSAYSPDLPIHGRVAMEQCLQQQWQLIAQHTPHRTGAGQLVAIVTHQDGIWHEQSRGFVLP